MRSSSGSAKPDVTEHPTILLAFGVGFSYQLGLDDVSKSGEPRSGEGCAMGAAGGSVMGFAGRGSNHRQEKSVWSPDSLGEETRGFVDPDGPLVSPLLSRDGTRSEGKRICASVQPFPTPVPLDRYLKRDDMPAHAAAGANHSVLLTREGKLFRWGVEDGGIFRVPTAVCTHIPLPCVQVCCGRKHTVALMQGGFVVTWGTGYFGQLGHGDNISYRHPRLLRRLDPQRLGERVTQIACGGYHSAVVTDGGRVFSWGFNRYGQCGNGSKDNTVGEPAPVVLSEVRPGGLGKNPKVVCGRHHTALVTGWGGLYTWGACSFGKLGLSDPEKTVCSPQEVTFFADKPLLQAAAGDFHMVALSRRREVFSWGYGAEGQGGHGNLLHMRTPRRVNALQDVPIAQVACGPWWSMAVTVDGYCYSWGCADGGWTGLALTKGLSVMDPGPANDRAVETESFDSCHNVHVPELVYSLAPYRVLQVGCGGGHSLVVATPRAPAPIPNAPKPHHSGLARPGGFSSSSRAASDGKSSSSSLQSQPPQSAVKNASAIGNAPSSAGVPAPATVSGWTSTSGSGWDSGPHGEGAVGSATGAGLARAGGATGANPSQGHAAPRPPASASGAMMPNASGRRTTSDGDRGRSAVGSGGGDHNPGLALDGRALGHGLASAVAVAAGSSSSSSSLSSLGAATAAAATATAAAAVFPVPDHARGIEVGLRRVDEAGASVFESELTTPAAVGATGRSPPTMRALRDGNRRAVIASGLGCDGGRGGGGGGEHKRGADSPNERPEARRPAEREAGRGSPNMRPMPPTLPASSGETGPVASSPPLLVRPEVGRESGSKVPTRRGTADGEMRGGYDEKRGTPGNRDRERYPSLRASPQGSVDSGTTVDGAVEVSRLRSPLGDGLMGAEYVAKVFSYCRHGRLEQVKAALDEGFDVCGQRDENGNTLLHCAAQNGLRCMCKTVLQGGTVSSLNLKNSQGNTALHYAFAFGFHQLGKYLAMNGADDTLLNDQGLTCYEGLDRNDHDML